MFNSFFFRVFVFPTTLGVPRVRNPWFIQTAYCVNCDRVIEPRDSQSGSCVGLGQQQHWCHLAVSCRLFNYNNCCAASCLYCCLLLLYRESETKNCTSKSRWLCNRTADVNVSHNWWKKCLYELTKSFFLNYVLLKLYLHTLTWNFLSRMACLCLATDKNCLVGRKLLYRPTLVNMQSGYTVLCGEGV